MRHLVAAARDELKTLLSDHGVLVVLVGGTLFYALFYPMPYRDQVARDVPVAVVDLDRSAASREMIRMLDATEQIAVIKVVRARADGERRMRRGEVGGLVEIPADFERQILRGEIAHIGIWGNAAYILLYSQVATGASTVAGMFSAGVVMARLEGAGMPEIEALMRADPVNLDLHELFNPGGGYGTYVVPAVLILILQQTLLIAVGMMGAARAIRERQARTAEPLMLGMIGRSLPYVAIHLVLTLVVLGVVYRIYAFPSFAPILASLGVLLPFLFATVFFGFMLTAFFGSRETALQILMLVSMPTLFLAGFAWPAQAMPAPLVAFGWLLPSTAGIDSFVRFHQMGAGFAEILDSWLWLWGLAMVYGVISILVCATRPEAKTA